MCQCWLKTVACVTEVQLARSFLMKLVDQVRERKAVKFALFPLLERARNGSSARCSSASWAAAVYSRIRRFVRFDVSAMTCHSVCVIVHDGAPVKNAPAQCSQTATANAGVSLSQVVKSLNPAQAMEPRSTVSSAGLV
jgi:hypothetical protein